MKTLINLLWLFTLFTACLFQPTYADPPLPTPVGRVVWVKGTLKAIMENKEVRTLQKTSLIYLHDTLITDTASQAQIVFTDNTLMTFREETKFVVDKYDYTPKAKGKSIGKYIMNLITGGFRTITGLIAKKNPSDYQVNTPVATIGVRGTDYTVYVNPKGEMFIGYYSGSPCVSAQKSTVCLSNEVKYAKVPTLGAAPVPLTQQPDVFKQKLDVVPAKIAPFNAGGPGSSGGGGSTGRGGTVTSFCIQ